MDLMETNYSEQGMGICGYGCGHQEERYRRCKADKEKYEADLVQAKKDIADYKNNPKRLEYNQLKTTLSEKLMQVKNLEMELNTERLKTEQYRQNPALNLEGMGFFWNCFKCKWTKKEAADMCKQKEKARGAFDAEDKVRYMEARAEKDTQPLRNDIDKQNKKIKELQDYINAEKQLQESIRNAEKLRLESEKTLATATIEDKTADGFNMNKILYIALGVLAVKVLFFPNTSKGSKNVIRVKA